MNTNNGDSSEEKTAQKQPDAPPSRPQKKSTLRWLIFGSLGLATVLACIIYLVLPLLLETPMAENDTAPTEQLPAATRLTYEEPLSLDLQEQAIRVDALITRVLIELEAAPASIETFAFPATGTENFRARSLGFQIKATPSVFQARLTKLLAEQLPKALLTPSGPRQFSIIISGVRTHELFLEYKEPASPSALPGSPMPPASTQPVNIVGQLAIVIDDLGEDVPLATGLATSGLDITFAVWPSSSHKDKICSLAKEHNLDLLVHLPMEPVSYPENHPGPDALYVAMNPEEIAATIARNLDKVPEAIGVNNHMGSRFTANKLAMTMALSEINKRNLFFLDSRTTARSMVSTAAKTIGIPHYSRDIFIDNEKDVAYIVKQLEKAETIARRKGSAIAIGHPHQETLEAIKIWANKANRNIAVVKISALRPII